MSSSSSSADRAAKPPTRQGVSSSVGRFATQAPDVHGDRRLVRLGESGDRPRLCVSVAGVHRSFFW